jgi:hypothetical protein
MLPFCTTHSAMGGRSLSLSPALFCSRCVDSSMMKMMKNNITNFFVVEMNMTENIVIDCLDVLSEFEAQLLSCVFLPSQNLFIISFFFCMFDIVDVYRCLLCDR